MASDGVRRKIDNTIKLVFQCNFTEVLQNTVEVVEYIEKNDVFFNEENKKKWKQIMQYLMIGLENKDYLTVGDILNYELKPMLNKSL
ncbi:hypothetical protein FDG09_08330 [Clostridium sporogenes]|uniref:hypothetical protein n=1 Tax=Clostridium TaxID=1485 RepID=UPI0013D2F0CD|nr:hypothetical protein [Clostridium sporogenes]EJP6470963.1 hypothetical protein [Clostridium botulinum]NFV12936.1 hypothetical protein [Clostridium sporogenes]